jgi:hypothetical protein
MAITPATVQPFNKDSATQHPITVKKDSRFAKICKIFSDFVRFFTKWRETSSIKKPASTIAEVIQPQNSVENSKVKAPKPIFKPGYVYSEQADGSWVGKKATITRVPPSTRGYNPTTHRYQ